jgi:ribosomal protein L19
MPVVEHYKFFIANDELWKRKFVRSWVKFFKISSFVEVVHYSEAYYSLRFVGVCVRRSHKWSSSSFTLMDRAGISQQFFLFSLATKLVRIIKFKRTHKFKRK